MHHAERPEQVLGRTSRNQYMLLTPGQGGEVSKNRGEQAQMKPGSTQRSCLVENSAPVKARYCPPNTPVAGEQPLEPAWSPIKN